MRVLVRERARRSFRRPREARSSRGTAGVTRTGALVAFCSTMLTTLLLIILVLALVGGGVGYSRYGYGSWSPAAIIVVILLLLLFLGRL